MNIDIWSVIILIIIVQGLFLLSVLLLSSQKRAKKGNTFLMGLIIVFIWFLAEFLAVRNTIKINLDIFYGTRYGSWMLLGPLTFLFFRSITTSNRKLSTKDLLHFLPFIVFVLIIPYLSGASLSRRQIHYGMLAVFDHRPKTVTPFEYLYSVIFFLQFIHLGSYLLFNLKTIRTYSGNLKSEYSNINHIIWLKVFNMLLIFVLILASAYLYILFVSDFYTRSMDYIYVLPMGIFVYSVGYHLSGLNWLAVHSDKKKYTGSSLKNTAKAAYIEQLESLIQSHKPHLKNDLRLKELAAMMRISNHHLSQLINENYNCSFFDFINRYRVEEAKKRIVVQPQATLLQVAFDSGFNNKTSFVNAFKKFERKTPSAFRKEKTPARFR